MIEEYCSCKGDKEICVCLILGAIESNNVDSRAIFRLSLNGLRICCYMFSFQLCNVKFFRKNLSVVYGRVRLRGKGFYESQRA